MSNDHATGDEVIRCEQLTKRYPEGDILAVDRLDLRVRPGEIFGLLGPNGAGKTTTVGMLTTLVVPTSGKAMVAGIDVVAHPALVKQVIGVVAQTNNLDRALTVWENLYYHGLFFGMSARESREATDKFLVDFRLTERAKADVMAISGGMAKRLQVARALLHRPSVLFLDEPTAGLDPQSRLALWEILGKLHAEGQTILLTTHYMEEADSLCERIAIIDYGRILAMDTPRNLKKSVGADSIVTISSTGDLDALGRLLQDRVEGATTSRRRDNVLQLHIKGTTGVLPKVVAIAEEGGFHITDLSVTEPTLETVFINLTGKELRD
jgi:ABC-2 type transport system ATP-binding protein